MNLPLFSRLFVKFCCEKQKFSRKYENENFCFNSTWDVTWDVIWVAIQRCHLGCHLVCKRRFKLDSHLGCHQSFHLDCHTGFHLALSSEMTCSPFIFTHFSLNMWRHTWRKLEPSTRNCNFYKQFPSHVSCK
jgi:hypothetical protein